MPVRSAVRGDTPVRPVDILLTDIQMKRMNGDEVCMLLRRAGLAIPILAMSGEQWAVPSHELNTVLLYPIAL